MSGLLSNLCESKSCGGLSVGERAPLPRCNSTPSIDSNFRTNLLRYKQGPMILGIDKTTTKFIKDPTGLIAKLKPINNSIIVENYFDITLIKDVLKGKNKDYTIEWINIDL